MQPTSVHFPQSATTEQAGLATTSHQMHPSPKATCPPAAAQPRPDPTQPAYYPPDAAHRETGLQVRKDLNVYRLRPLSNICQIFFTEKI